MVEVQKKVPDDVISLLQLYPIMN